MPEPVGRNAWSVDSRPRVGVLDPRGGDTRTIDRKRGGGETFCDRKQAGSSVAQGTIVVGRSTVASRCSSPPRDGFERLQQRLAINEGPRTG